MPSFLEMYGPKAGAGGDPGASPLTVPVRVQRTMDGDTAEASTRRTGKVALPYRLAGIDAPESAQGALGAEAQAFLDELVEAQGGNLREGGRGTDRHGRRLATLYAGDKNVNVELVRAGHAKVYERYLDRLSAPLAKALMDAQEEAKGAARGVWAAGMGDNDPEAFRRSQEALLGSRAGAAGHVKRERRDEGMMSGSEFLKRFGPAQGLGRRGGEFPKETSAPAGPKIMAEDRYQKEEGFLDHALGGLDYAGNVARSGLLGALEGGRGLDYARQALTKDRKTTSTRLKDAATEKLGLGKVRLGKDDGNFQLGDLGDFAADLTVDIFTDPVNALTMGVGRVLKGGGTIAKAAAGAKLAEAGEAPLSKAAARYLKGKTLAQAGLGAMYGYGSQDADAELGQKLFYGGVGAALGAGAGPAMGKMGAAARENFDKVTNWYAAKTRGSAFADFAGQRAVALEAFDKKKNIAEWIRQGRLEALEGLDEVGRIKATNVMKELKTKSIELRNAAQKGLKIRNGTPEFDDLTRQINEQVEKEWLPKLVAEGDTETMMAINKWTGHNQRVVDKWNTIIHGSKDHPNGMVGLRFHVDDVFKKEDIEQGIEEAGNALKELGWQKASKETRQVNNLSPDQSYAVYAENAAAKFWTKQEQEAVRILADYQKAAIDQSSFLGKYAAKAEPALKVFDKLTNFAKANMLYFSTSWLKNNYHDNLGKAWIENGIPGIVGAGTMGRLSKGLQKDIDALYQGNIARAYQDVDFKDMLNLGVLDNPMYKSMTDEITRDFLYRPDDILKANDKTIGNYARKAQEWWFTKNPVIGLVSRVGSFMEGSARAMTYKNTLDTLRKTKGFQGVSDASLKRIAARVVKNTFFDYGDVTALEGAVLKRIVPFYSFYSKNVPYWIKATFDPERAGRVLSLDKVRTNIGDDPTSSEKAGMTPYLAENAPRSLGQNEKGDEVYLVTPSASMHDAIKVMNPMAAGSQLVEKGNTLVKGAYELATGKDLFSGGALYPGDELGGKKYLYGRGFKIYAVKKALEYLGFDADGMVQEIAGTSGVEVDSRGNPYTTKGWTVVLDKIASTMLPHGFIDQVAGSVGKKATGKETLDEIIFSRLSPMQKVKVSPDQARMVRQRKAAEKEGS